MAHRVPITVRLETFEGPLDLLLYLIQSHELDISRVSISHITDQYLSYVRLMQELNFDTASEFLVMAATLLHWKSKSLLPDENKQNGAQASEEDGVMSQEDLIRQLLEHQKFRAAGESLAQLPRLGEDVFTRHNRKPPIQRVWKEMNITDLAMSLQETLVRARKRTTILKKVTVSLTDKIMEFGSKLQVGKLIEMKKLMSENPIKAEVVVTFLASLELSRLKKLRVHQELVYGPILMELLESLKNLDMSLASGFDSPIAKVQAEMDQKDAAAAAAQTEAAPAPEFDLASFDPFTDPSKEAGTSPGIAPQLEPALAGALESLEFGDITQLEHETV